MASIKEDIVYLSDLAPDFDPNKEYDTTDMVVVDGVLMHCTSAGRGEEAEFSPAKVQDVIDAVSHALKNSVAHVWSENQNTPNKYIDGNRKYGYAARTWTRSDTGETYSYGGYNTSSGLHEWATSGSSVRKLTYNPSDGVIKSDDHKIATVQTHINLWTAKIPPIVLDGNTFTYTEDASYFEIGTFAFLSDIPEKLPSPKSLTISVWNNGLNTETYDGSEPRSISYAKDDRLGLVRITDDVNNSSNQNSGVAATPLSVRKSIRYDIVEKTIVEGSVDLDDRTINYVDATSAQSVSLSFPDSVDGKARDFAMVLVCGDTLPTIDYASIITIFAESGDELVPEKGFNIYSFTEIYGGRFVSSRELVESVVDNSPESTDQLLLAMARAGYPTQGVSSYGGVMQSMELSDDKTPQDAINKIYE